MRYTRVHTDKALLHSRAIQGLPWDTPGSIQTRLCCIQEQFKDCHEIHQGPYRQGSVAFKSNSRNAMRYTRVHTDKALLYSRAIQGLSWDTPRSTQTMLCCIQGQFKDCHEIHQGPYRQGFIVFKSNSRTAMRYTRVHTDKAMLYSRAFQGLPWDTPGSIQTRLCCIQEQFKDCHEIHQGPYRQGYVVFKSNSRTAMRYTKVHTDKALLYSRAIQGLPWDTPGSIQTRLCCIQEQFKDCHEIHQGPHRQGYVVFKSNSRTSMRYTSHGPYRQGYVVFKSNSRTAMSAPRSIQTRLCCIQEQFKDCHEIHQGPYRQGSVVFKSNSRTVMRYTRVHTDKAMLYSRAIEGMPWDTPGSIQTRLCCIQEQFKDCHEIHQGPYRQGYVAFKSNSRAVMRYTRVHTDKALLYSRAIQGLSWDTPGSIQTRLCCIQEQFKECHEIHQGPYRQGYVAFKSNSRNAMRYTKVHTDKAMLYSRAIQGLSWDTPGSIQTRLCCIPKQFKECHEIHQGPYRQCYIKFKNLSKTANRYT